MKPNKLAYLVVILTWCLIFTPQIRMANAAMTTSVLGGGVSINEILINPVGSTTSFDTDQNGTADELDEFIELYNGSSKTIDISGWEMWDSLKLKWFTFPGTPDSETTMLASGAYAVVVIGVQSGGSLPMMTNPNSLSFDAGRGSSVMNDTGDNVLLYDPGDNKYIQLTYNADAIDDPTSQYAGFSATAVRNGTVEDFGTHESGKSLSRYPSGDTCVVVHDAIPGAGNASPTAVHMHNFQARWLTPGQPIISIVRLLVTAILTGAFILLLGTSKKPGGRSKSNP